MDAAYAWAWIMGGIWIVDLRQYLTHTGAIADLQPRARILAEYFVSIVVDATTNIGNPPTVRCRRRPKDRRCAGIVLSCPTGDESGSIHWHCPVCEDNGLIVGWRNTLWDGFAELHVSS